MRSNGVEMILRPAGEMTVKVTDAVGAPVADAAVVAIGASEISIPLARGKTATDGLVTLRYPADAAIDGVFAMKAGAGFDHWFSPEESDDQAEIPRQISLQLQGAFTAHVRVVDDGGEPVAGAQVQVEQMSSSRAAARAGRTPYLRFCKETSARTDNDGVARFDWLPADRQGAVVFDLYSQDFKAPKRARLPLGRVVKSNAVGPHEIALPVVRLTTISGTVTDAAGKPVAGVGIDAVGNSGGVLQWEYSTSSQTGADGRYALRALPQCMYDIYVADNDWAAAARGGVLVRPGRPVDGVDFQVIPGTVLRGTVTHGKVRRPAPDRLVLLRQPVDPFPVDELTDDERAQFLRQLDHHAMQCIRSTDAEGKYQFRAAPGECTLSTGGNPVPRSRQTVDLKIRGEPEIVRDFHLEGAEREILSVTVIDATDNAVKDATVRAMYIDLVLPYPDVELKATRKSEGTHRLLRLPVPVWLFGSSADGALASRARVDAEQNAVTLKLEPAATIVGRLVDRDSPIEGAEIFYRMMFSNGGGTGLGARLRIRSLGTILTAADGRFALQALMVGGRYEAEVAFRGEDGTFPLQNLTAARPGHIDLGYIEVPPWRQFVTDDNRAVREVPVAARAASRFNPKASLADRLSAAAADAKLEYRRMLLVLGDPESPATQSLFKVVDRIEANPDLTRLLAGFEPVYANVSDRDGMAHLARVCQIRASMVGAPSVAVLGDDGELLSQQEFAAAGDPPQIDLKALTDLLKQYAPPERDAAELVRSATRRAREEKKLVLLQQSEALSYPSRLLSRFLDQHRDLLERDYVYVALDAFRSTGGEAVIGQFRKKKGTVPWMAILNADGVTLADSDSPAGNLGFPSEPEAVDYFIDQMLTPTAQRLTAAQLDELRKALNGGH